MSHQIGWIFGFVHKYFSLHLVYLRRIKRNTSLFLFLSCGDRCLWYNRKVPEKTIKSFHSLICIFSLQAFTKLWKGLTAVSCWVNPRVTSYGLSTPPTRIASTSMCGCHTLPGKRDLSWWVLPLPQCVGATPSHVEETCHGEFFLYPNVWVPHPPREKRPVMVSSSSTPVCGCHILPCRRDLPWWVLSLLQCVGATPSQGEETCHGESCLYLNVWMPHPPM